MAFEDIRQKVAAACGAAGRPLSSVTLIAVTKGRTPEEIRPMLDVGHRVFGENRVQEAEGKWPALRAEYPGVELHFIGQLQSNKAKEAVALFDVIHTVDRESLATALQKEMEKQQRRLPCFIQVNTGDEPQKGGVSPKELVTLHGFCTAQAKLDIAGLMCIPPANDIPDLHFALLRKLAASLKLENLSMGMSGDFESAIRYGATHVRIGTALF